MTAIMMMQTTMTMRKRATIRRVTAESVVPGYAEVVVAAREENEAAVDVFEGAATAADAVTRCEGVDEAAVAEAVRVACEVLRKLVAMGLRFERLEKV